VENHQQINQDSGNTEWYTPPHIIRAARLTMGGIDLDPASSEAANKRVGADHFFSEMGLFWEWRGRVWMNHPFSRVGNKAWIEKLIEEYSAGRVSEACCITFAATSEKWFQPLMQFPQCYLSPRTQYMLPDGKVKKGVTKGSVVTYLGPNLSAFALNFDWLGAIKVAY